jgi:ADP-ribose pyrophosphatase YjhB (NUDIX family)
MSSAVRYQAAIIQNDHLLLLKVWDHAYSGNTFWVIPGGGRHPNESEEDCVRREVLEETHLHIEIDRLILDEDDQTEGSYQRAQNLCLPHSQRRAATRIGAGGGYSRPRHDYTARMV